MTLRELRSGLKSGYVNEYSPSGLKKVFLKESRIKRRSFFMFEEAPSMESVWERQECRWSGAERVGSLERVE